jgi:hypothetical protein
MSKKKSVTAVVSSELVRPQPGEYWEHSYHGAVKVIRRWNDHECVCDVLAYDETRPIEVRRRLLCDELMKGRLRPNAGADAPRK